MHLEALKILRAVVDQGGFGRAGRAVHLSQSAISQAIARLEEEVGLPLLNRGRPPTLTAAGRRVYDHAGDVLSRDQLVRRELEELARGGEGVLSLGASQALSRCLVQAATADDRRLLVRWIFSAVSVHPDLGDVAAPEDADRNRIAKEAAGVFERLVAQDCAAASRQAILEDGMDGYGDAFRTLGEMAMQDFLVHKDVEAEMTSIGRHVDQQRILKGLLGP